MPTNNAKSRTTTRKTPFPEFPPQIFSPGPTPANPLPASSVRGDGRYQWGVTQDWPGGCGKVFPAGSMVAPASPASSPRQPSHGRPLRLSMVPAGRTRRTKPQDIVCSPLLRWERMRTPADFGTINPPRAAQTPGGRPDGRTVDPSTPARRSTRPTAGAPGVIGRARCPSASASPLRTRYNSRYVRTWERRRDRGGRAGRGGVLDLDRRGARGSAGKRRQQHKRQHKRRRGARSTPQATSRTRRAPSQS